MPVYLLRRSDLTSDQVKAISARKSAPEHNYDNGPIRCWGSPSAEAQMYVAFLRDNATDDVPFGMVSVGGELDNTIVAWWIDKAFRGRNFGSQVVDALVVVLRARKVTNIGALPIDTFRGEYHEQSLALANKLKSHFEHESAALNFPNQSTRRISG